MCMLQYIMNLYKTESKAGLKQREINSLLLYVYTHDKIKTDLLQTWPWDKKFPQQRSQPPALQKVAVKHSAIKGAKAIFQVNVIIFPAIGSYVIKILSVPDILKLSNFTRAHKIWFWKLLSQENSAIKPNISATEGSVLWLLLTLVFSSAAFKCLQQ